MPGYGGTKIGFMRDLITNALTIDVEDAVNQAMRNIFRTDMEPTVRVLNNTMRLLDLLSEHNTIATFFILGEVARTYPELVRNISEHGHELGIHGYSHDRYYNMTPVKAKEEIVSSKHLIEDITGKEVLGHRAPEFSIGKNNLWVLDLLLDAGIKYDSSIFPVKSDRYGWPGFVKEIGYFNLADGRKIIEAPLSVVDILGKEFPSCGGGYLRAFPYYFTDFAFRQIIKQRPVIVYLHPYEIDPPPFQKFYTDAIRRSPISVQIQLRKYWFNRESVMPKLNKLLKTYKFSTLRDIINQKLPEAF
ncbi:MAG: DUF3473 domain-containing protein [Bacteroidales bacterium]|nr:DUF3473 domain-containing protein [Bacteroidales bacterium]